MSRVASQLSARAAIVVLTDAAMNGRLRVDRERGMVCAGVPGLMVSARVRAGALVQIDALDASGVLQSLRPGDLEFPSAAGELDACLHRAGERPILDWPGGSERPNPFLKTEPTPEDRSFSGRSKAIADRGAKARAALVAAQLDYLSEVEGAADAVAAAQAELDECSRLTAQLHEEERAYRAKSVRANVEADPRILIAAAEGRHAGRVVELLQSLPSDAWTESLIARVSSWRGHSPCRGELWGPEWNRVVDEIRAFTLDRFAGRAA